MTEERLDRIEERLRHERLSRKKLHRVTSKLHEKVDEMRFDVDAMANYLTNLGFKIDSSFETKKLGWYLKEIRKRGS